MLFVTKSLNFLLKEQIHKTPSMLYNVSSKEKQTCDLSFFCLLGPDPFTLITQRTHYGNAVIEP